LLGGLINGTALIYRPQQADHAAIQGVGQVQFALDPGWGYVFIRFFGHFITLKCDD
jgi:hypothetical protein